MSGTSPATVNDSPAKKAHEEAKEPKWILSKDIEVDDVFVHSVRSHNPRFSQGGV